jgi:hypothetical protein
MYLQDLDGPAQTVGEYGQLHVLALGNPPPIFPLARERFGGLGVLEADSHFNGPEKPILGPRNAFHSVARVN